MKKDKRNSTVSFSSHPSFVIQTINDQDWKARESIKEDEPVVAPLVELPPPPDGGWGWVIVFASFMCNLILDGIAYTFGVLLAPLVRDFDSNRGTVSWVGSLLAGVYLMSGPIVGGLVNKFGCRMVCIFGSIVACIGFCLSTLSPNVPILMLTYGVIGGFGLGLIYLPAVVAVGYYFESKRALATGISVCGSGVGTFLFAPLATHLLEAYGWKGSNLIFAGLCLNCAVFGALMRPLELKAKVIEPNETLLEEDNYEDEEHAGFQFRADSGSGIKPEKEMEPLINDPGLSLVHVPSNLPTITEQSITAALTKKEEDRPKVTDIFPTPEIQVPESEARRPSHRERKLSGRMRNTSGETPTSRFQVMPSIQVDLVSDEIHELTPIRKKLGPIPRNSSAPHFIDANKILPRNVSTPGFAIGGKNPNLRPTYGSQLSADSNQQHVMFGIEAGSNTQLSNTQLYLEPSSLSRRNSRRGSSKALVRPFSRKDLFYGGSVHHLVDQNEMPANWDQYRHSIISTPRRLSSFPRGSIVASHLSLPMSERKASSVVPDELLEPEGAQPIWNALKEMVNLTLLVNPIFLLVGISNVFGMLGFYVPFVYLPNMAVLRGVSVENANFLLSIIGISNTIGRVISGWFSDFSWVDSLLVTNLAILFSGISTLVLPFCTTYASFVIIALLFGLFVAAYISLTSIVLVDLLGLDNLTSAFGLMTLFRGVSSMIGPPVAGAVYDATETYDVPFFMAGGFLILASLISFAAQFLQRKQRRAKEEKAQQK